FVHVTHGQDEAMALADLVVLMNNGVIEQLGTPRDIFNRPKTEFAARVIGGHAGLPHGNELITVRNDQNAGKGAGERVTGSFVAGIVTDIAYQGSHIRVAISGDGNPDISAELAESAFDVSPFAVGDRVLATWSPDRAHRLDSTLSATVATVNA